MFGRIGGWELLVIGMVALLIFGRRLPDVARSLGKSIIEFKKGLKDVKDEIDPDKQLRSNQPARLEQRPENPAPITPASTHNTTSAPH